MPHTYIPEQQQQKKKNKNMSKSQRHCLQKNNKFQFDQNDDSFPHSSIHWGFKNKFHFLIKKHLNSFLYYLLLLKQKKNTNFK